METWSIRKVSKAQIFGIIGDLLLIIGGSLPLFFSYSPWKNLSVSFLTLGFDIIDIPLIIIALVIIGVLGTKKIQQAQGAGVAVVILILFVFMAAFLVNNGLNLPEDQSLIWH